MAITRRLGAAALVLASLALWADPAGAGPQAAGFRLVPVARGLSGPIYVAQAPGDSRLFVVEQQGVIRVVQRGTLLARPFADLTSLVTGR
ncbi:MAG: hypothetical protein ABI317_09970 [Gaiellales bacterium]